MKQSFSALRIKERDIVPWLPGSENNENLVKISTRVATAIGGKITVEQVLRCVQKGGDPEMLLDEPKPAAVTPAQETPAPKTETPAPETKDAGGEKPDKPDGETEQPDGGDAQTQDAGQQQDGGAEAKPKRQKQEKKAVGAPTLVV